MLAAFCKNENSSRLRGLGRQQNAVTVTFSSRFFSPLHSRGCWTAVIEDQQDTLAL